MDSVEGASITIKWKLNPAADKKYVILSEYLDYIVRYKKSRSQADDFECIRINGLNTSHATLKNLEEGTQYTIQVAAAERHDNRTGNYSEPLNVTTDRGEYKNSYLSI